MRQEKRKPAGGICNANARNRSTRGDATAAITSPRRSPRLHALKEEDPSALARSSCKKRGSKNTVPKSKPSSSRSDVKNRRKSARLMAISGKAFEPEIRDPENNGSDSASPIMLLPSRESDTPTSSSDCSAGLEENLIVGEKPKTKRRKISEAPKIKNREEKKLKRVKDQKEFPSKKFDGDESLEWTWEQELALRNAYVLAKPSPHFWKKVSKMVPGKSARECFDRMHSKMATPAQLPPRSKSKLPVDLSPLPCGNLFGKNPKKTKGGRNKVMRQILRKHSAVDFYQDVDLFSVLEKTSENAFPEVSLTLSENELSGDSPSPVRVLKMETETKKKRGLSRFCGPSPEILRPVKNIVLHERYIDRLHCRETKKSMHSDRRIHCVGKENVVNTAKTALISEAKEFIHQFGHKLADPLRNYNVEDEGEGEGEELEFREDEVDNFA